MIAQLRVIIAVSRGMYELELNYRFKYNGL